MGVNTKALKNRIRSVDSTLHLTSAMGLVAASKMRRASEAMHNGRQYAAAYGRVMNVLTASRNAAAALTCVRKGIVPA